MTPACAAPRCSARRRMAAPLACAGAALALLLPAVVAAADCSGLDTGVGAALHGFLPFGANSAWNQDISSAAVDPNSAALIAAIGSNTRLHADFGSGTYNGSTIGIPYEVVSAQPPVKVRITQVPEESDPGPMPIPRDAPVEGYPQTSPSGDRHVLILDRDHCWLYELYGAQRSVGAWSAGSTAIWDLLDDARRPYTWTSADAAGLSIFAGLARYDEVAAGAIRHALRFTIPSTRQAFVLPATHWAATSSNANAAPMGMRLRLKAGYDISGFPPQARTVLAALKKYGMILADNGSGVFISGAPDERWNNDDLASLQQVPASAFDVLYINPVYTPANVPQGSAPTLTALKASPATVSAGQTTTLSWVTNQAEYVIVSPQIGPVRGNSVSLSPRRTTTYTVYATNEYGRSQASITVKVQ